MRLPWGIALERASSLAAISRLRSSFLAMDPVGERAGELPVVASWVVAVDCATSDVPARRYMAIDAERSRNESLGDPSLPGFASIRLADPGSGPPNARDAAHCWQ
jgi:hypothetical protein